MGDYRTTTGEPAPRSGKKLRRRLKIILRRAFIGLALVTASGFLVRVHRYVPAVGYVTTADYAEVRPAGQGAVAAILAGTGEYVEQGQVLVRLEDGVARAQLEEARTRVRLAEAEYARREVEIAERMRHHAEQTAAAEWNLEHARNRLKRTRELVSRGLVAGSVLEDREMEARLARARLDSLLAMNPAVFESELAVLQRDIEARRKEEAAAEARAEAHLVRAPLAGRLLRYEFVPGELVRPENVLYELFGGPVNTMKLRVAERHAMRVAPGQRYRARLALYRRPRPVYFHGQVLSLRHVIQTQGDRTYRVAYCDFDDEGRGIPPGTTAEARIYRDRVSLWTYLLGLD